MKGYWQQEEETKQVLSEDGWLRTGDIAIFEEGGFLKIIDRKKDMILVSGFNVYPNEIEDVLAKHPDVLEVAALVFLMIGQERLYVYLLCLKMINFLKTILWNIAKNIL